MSLCGQLRAIISSGGEAKTNSDYDELVAEEVSRVPVDAPEWTDFNDSDPGITLLELIAFLARGLLYSGLVFRLLRGVGLIDRVVWSVTVEDGWRRVDDLSDSGPTDRHYVVDEKTGEVRFGDGVHGARPPSGSAITKSTYRMGAGAAAALGVAVVVWVGLLSVWCWFRGRRAS